MIFIHDAVIRKLIILPRIITGEIYNSHYVPLFIFSIKPSAKVAPFGSFAVDWRI